MAEISPIHAISSTGDRATTKRTDEHGREHDDGSH